MARGDGERAHQRSASGVDTGANPRRLRIARPSHRAPGRNARRVTVACARASRRLVVNESAAVIAASPSQSAAPRAWPILGQVPDPEIPVLSVVDLGIVRDVKESADGRRVTVTLTPTYSGCPATEVITQDVRAALAAIYDTVEIRIQLSPAWTTDWLSRAGRDKLFGYGIAPPAQHTVVADGRKSLPILDIGSPDACPQCGSQEVEEISGFGSTPCKALWRCGTCREPFDYFKAH
jgi:ring-1,2-phenylacetyl-CoA epoxidase subunit PaaD